MKSERKFEVIGLLLTRAVALLCLVAGFGRDWAVIGFCVGSIGLQILYFCGYQNCRDRNLTSRSTLKFLQQLLFSLRWGQNYQAALEQANRQLKPIGVTVTATSEPFDLEIRKLNFGALRPTFETITANSRSREPARFDFSRRLLTVYLWRLEKEDKELTEFETVELAETALLIGLAFFIAASRRIFQSPVTTGFKIALFGVLIGFEITVTYLIFDYGRKSTC